MSHHPHSPHEESTGEKLAGLGFSVFGIAVAGFAAFWGLAFLYGGFAAARPQPEPKPAEVAAALVPSAPEAASPAAAPAPTVTPAPTASVAPAVADAAALPNMFPPLAGSDWVNAPGSERLIRIVVHGFQGPINVNGKPFASLAPMMPPQGALPDKQIAAVLTYARNAFGNKGSAVTPEQVKAVRDAEKDRVAMWDEASLLKVPVIGAQP
jgi:mono/diheme cytochrome c family protein